MNQVERRKKQMAYIADQECGEEMNACKRILHELNTVDRTDGDAICEIVKRLFGKSDGAFVNPPFYCDYGKNIEVGKNFFANYNQKFIISQVFIAPHRVLIKSSESLENKGFIAISPPYPFI